MITITVRERSLRPRDTVEGRVEWHLENAPKDLQLRLCWFTRGRGTEEGETVEALPLGDTVSGARDFSFVLPGEPWSFDGKLIQLAWGLEVVAKRAGGLALEELVVAPDRTVRTLGEVAEPRSGGVGPKWMKRFTPPDEMTAGENPFAPDRLRRQLGFDPALAGTTWEVLDARWRELGCRAAVTGHHGSGKTSLLDAWALRLDEEPLRLFFNESRRDFDPQDHAVLASCAGKILFVDGENHLSWRRRRELRRAARAARGVLVARHCSGGWPELVRLSSDPAQAAILLERAAPEWAGHFLPEVRLRWEKCGGNLRELLLGCYDDLATGKKTFEII